MGQHQVYVTEIVLPLRFADAISRRERNDDRKCVCCSQATEEPVFCSQQYTVLNENDKINKSINSRAAMIVSVDFYRLIDKIDNNQFE